MLHNVDNTHLLRIFTDFDLPCCEPLKDAHMTLLDPELVRAAFGHFATGVTIVTSTDANGAQLGMTASSFNSVSLDPPMVLWSAGAQAPEFEGFAACTKFAVHVLSDAQVALSNRFATPGIDKFEGVQWDTSEHQLPVIADCSLCLQCETVDCHDAGDHKILIGRVLAVDINPNKAPLLYYGSAYHQLGGKI